MSKKCLLVLPMTVLATTVLVAQDSVTVNVNASERQGRFRPVWAWVGHDEPNYTYSEEGRELLKELSELSPYSVHDRAHFLLTTGDGTPALKWGSTNAYTLDAAGHPVYNWDIMDKIFDTYKATNTTPFVEIGFMPKALSPNPEPYEPHWPQRPYNTGWSYPPKDYKAWSDLIYLWVRHMVDRYGAQEVAKWEWEVWNEPDGGYWHGTVDDYCKLYDYTADAVKRALPGAHVGGPAVTDPGGERAANFLHSFLDHCANGKNYVTGKPGAPLDFISFHAKGRASLLDGHVELNIGNHLRDIDRGFAIIEGFPTLRALPVVLSESDPEGCAACDATSHPQNGYRLGSQYASYGADLLSGTLALAQRHHINLEGAITWAFTFPGEPIFAGFRAFTTHDIDLPLLNLYRMLGLMEGERVAASSTGALNLDDVLQSSVRTEPNVNVLATRGERTANVLVWNYHDDLLPAPEAEVDLTVQGVPKEAARVLVEHFRVGQDHSNSHTAWQAMGSPQNPSPEQYEHLKAAGQLQLLESPQWVPVEGSAIHLTFTEPRQGLSLLHITW
jgi:xylan 1,4-beta-xylosidase